MPTIDFDMQSQQHSNWCWAAVSVSIDRYFDPRSKWCQCRIASRMAKIRKLKVKNCGTCRKPKGVPKDCNRTWDLDRALTIVNRLKGRPRFKALSFKQIERRIRAGLPVCVRILWGQGPDAHFVVITGRVRGRSGEWVDVEDPHSGSSTWRYDEFRSNYQYYQGRWVATFPIKGNGAD